MPPIICCACISLISSIIFFSVGIWFSTESDIVFPYFHMMIIAPKKKPMFIICFQVNRLHKLRSQALMLKDDDFTTLVRGAPMALGLLCLFPMASIIITIIDAAH